MICLFANAKQGIAEKDMRTGISILVPFSVDESSLDMLLYLLMLYEAKHSSCEIIFALVLCSSFSLVVDGCCVLVAGFLSFY